MNPFALHHITLSLSDKLSHTQFQILYYLSLNSGSSSTAILEFINTPSRIFPIQPVRSQSAISHTLSDLVSWGYITRLHGGYYINTPKANKLVADTIHAAKHLDKDYDALFKKSTQEMHPVHVENATDKR